MFPRIDKGPVEYTLTVRHAWNAERSRPCVRFHFETTAEFSHFRYRISVEHEAAPGTLRFTIRGLRAGGMLPGTGTAQADVDLFDIAGTFALDIRKPGDIRARARIRVTASAVTLLEAPADEPAFIVIDAA